MWCSSTSQGSSRMWCSFLPLGETVILPTCFWVWSRNALTRHILHYIWCDIQDIWYDIFFMLREDTDTISLLGTRLSSCCHFGMSYMPQLGADEDSTATRVAVLLGSHQGPFWVIIGQEPRRFKKFDWSICRTCRWCRRSWKWFSKPMLVCLQRCGSHMTPEALQSVKCYCKSCSWSLAL